MPKELLEKFIRWTKLYGITTHPDEHTCASIFPEKVLFSPSSIGEGFEIVLDKPGLNYVFSETESLVLRAFLHDPDRKAGRTRKQLLGCEYRAIYICPNSHAASYTLELAKYLKREDLVITTPAWLDYHNCKGRSFSDIVLDHATSLTEKEMRDYTHIKRHCVVQNDFELPPSQWKMPGMK